MNRDHRANLSDLLHEICVGFLKSKCYQYNGFLEVFSQDIVLFILWFRGVLKNILAVNYLFYI